MLLKKMLGFFLAYIDKRDAYCKNFRRIIETASGWTNDITSIGDEDLIVILWANEIFDDDYPAKC